jgi:ribose transport system substrate-binding protein
LKRRQFLTLAAGAIAAPAILSNRSFAAGEKTVVFHLKNVTNPFYKNVRDGAEQAAKDLGLKLEIAAPTKPDNIEEQIRLVEDWIVKKPDGMVFVPVDYKAMTPAAEKIRNAKIPLVVYNNIIPQIAADTPFLGLDDVEIGHTIAVELFKNLGGKGKVIHIDGVPGAITAQDRKTGLEKALKEYPNIELLASQPGNYRRLSAVQVFENLMQRFPQIDGVVAANDDMAVGVGESAVGAGRGTIKVVGCDCIPDAVAAIKAGRQLGSIDTAPYSQGYLATRAMAEVLKGNKVPLKIILPLTFVNSSNVDAWLKPPAERPKPDWDKALKGST